MAIIMPLPDRLTRLTLAAGLPNFLRPDDPLVPALANAPGQRVFILSLPQIREERRELDGTTSAGWRFLATAGGQTAAAEVSQAADGEPPKLRSVSRGSQVAPAIQATYEAEGLDQASTQDFELRVLRVPGLLIECIWLKSQGGGEDLVIPYLTPARRPEAERILSIQRFLGVLRNSPAAKKDADDRPRYRRAGH